jgi:hypothetical protein
VRTIEVLVDRDAAASGAAATGEPWQYYDLGHGWCTYTFFEQCQHRMACARCDFYTPKDSSKAQLMEAKENLQRMLASIPLTEDERAAVDDGQSAMEALLARLTDIPTPAGRGTSACPQPSPCCPSWRYAKAGDHGNDLGGCPLSEVDAPRGGLTGLGALAWCIPVLLLSLYQV